MSKSFYSVSDLGEKLNVPRTTINDYLARYGHYIEFEIHGKRKVYTDKSLEILREIANMRAGNTAFYDIEQYLMQKYPVQPDLHQNSNKNNSEIKTESECSNMENNDENKNFQMVNIEEIKLGESIERIGAYAFYGNDNLKEINIPESVTEISRGAFS